MKKLELKHINYSIGVAVLSLFLIKMAITCLCFSMKNKLIFQVHVLTLFVLGSEAIWSSQDLTLGSVAYNQCFSIACSFAFGYDKRQWLYSKDKRTKKRSYIQLKASKIIKSFKKTYV